MKDTTVTYHISYLVFDDCMVRWCRNSLIKHQEPRARSRHYEQWVDIQYLQFRTISTQYLHSVYTVSTQYLQNIYAVSTLHSTQRKPGSYWIRVEDIEGRKPGTRPTKYLWRFTGSVKTSLCTVFIYTTHKLVLMPPKEGHWPKSHGHAKIGMLCPGLIVGGWFYWTFLAFHSGARCWAPDDHNISAKSPGYKPSELTFSQPAQWQTAYLCEPIWTWFLAKLGVSNWKAI